MTTAAAALDGQWHHIVAVYSGSEVAIHLDGVLQSSMATADPPANNTRALNIGRAWGGGAPTRHFPGRIDELKLYHRALSSQGDRQHLQLPDGLPATFPHD